MEFKDRLKALRKENRMTQAKLGELLNYGYTAIANYEAGRNQPSIPDLKKIASIFNVSMDYLLGVTDLRQPFSGDDETAEFNEFRRYYVQLSEEGKGELLEYMRYLVFKEQAPAAANDISYGEPKAKPVSLKVAQKPTEYTK